MYCYRLITIFVLAILGACADEISNGQVSFQWRLGSQGCAHYGVDSVRAQLFNFQSIGPLYSELFSCQEQEGQLTDIKPGDYSFVVEGLNDDGCVTHIGRRELVLGSSEALKLDAPVSLTRYKRPLQITWNFSDQLDCTGNRVKQVEIWVSVDDEEGFTEVRACEGFLSTIQSEFAPGDLNVTIFGVDDAGERTHRGEVQRSSEFFVNEPCKPTLDVFVILTPCVETGCDAT